MTVHFWGEQAEGSWTLEIVDSPSKLRNPEVLGEVQQHTFTFTIIIEADVLIQRKLIRSVITWDRQP